MTINGVSVRLDKVCKCGLIHSRGFNLRTGSRLLIRSGIANEPVARCYSSGNGSALGRPLVSVVS